MVEGNCPVNEGETYPVTIDKLGEKGDGIAIIEGYVIFIPDTNIGDKVKVKITRVLPRFAFGEIVNE